MTEFKIFKDWLTNVSFLTEKDCSLFEPYLKISRFEKKKDYFLNERKVCRHIGFINKGCFRTYYLSDGKEINAQFVFENEFVTDYDSFLQSKPSRYFIQALEDSEIVTFNFRYLKLLDTVGSLLLDKMDKRLYDHLKKKIKLNSSNSIKMIHNQIAIELGTAREVVSRVMKKLEIDRKVEQKSREIKIIGEW